MACKDDWETFVPENASWYNEEYPEPSEPGNTIVTKLEHCENAFAPIVVTEDGMVNAVKNVAPVAAFSAIAVIVGAACSSVAVFIGMYAATKANVITVLSGMSNFEQTKDNINTLTKLYVIVCETIVIMDTTGMDDKIKNALMRNF